MTEGILAYHGIIELVHWEETSNMGCRIKVALKSRDELAYFDKLTKRSKKHAGQRFGCVWQDRDGNPVDTGMPAELWFYGASWSHSSGAAVMFSVHPGEFAAVKAMRTRDSSDHSVDVIYMALVELDEDDRPIDQTQRGKVESHVKGGANSKNAGMLCQDPEFQRFVAGADPSIKATEEYAAKFVRTICGVESRAELDHDREALLRYHALKSDFIRWAGPDL